MTIEVQKDQAYRDFSPQIGSDLLDCKVNQGTHGMIVGYWSARHTHTHTHHTTQNFENESGRQIIVQDTSLWQSNMVYNANYPLIVDVQLPCSGDFT